jgi:hypothetical protein
LLGPSLDVPAHRWAQAAEEAEHEDFNPFPVRPLTLRGGPKHRKRVAPSEFVLRELSETVQVLESEKIAGSDAAVPDKVWLCMTARAQELQRWTTGGNAALVACFEPLNFSLSPYLPPSFFILPFDLDWEKKRSTAGRERARQSACKLVLRHEVNFRVNFYFLVSSSFYSLLGLFVSSLQKKVKWSVCEIFVRFVRLVYKEESFREGACYLYTLHGKACIVLVR